MNDLILPSPIQKIEDKWLDEKGVELFIKREDLIHPHVQGNKWRKLKYNLQEVERLGLHRLLTFGGAYSNHIYATAAAGELFNFKTIGVIRGEQPPVLSPTLQFAVAKGMELYFMDRKRYAEKDSREVYEELKDRFGDVYFIPEGGTNQNALRGVAELVEEIEVPFDVICTPVGTGGTLAGLLTALKGEKEALGFSSLKGEDTLTGEVNHLVKEYTGKTYSNFNINFDYHFGGYAKTQPDLLTFIKEFKAKYNIQLEPVYTGKMFYGLFDLIGKNYFPQGSRIIALHTGGLQVLNET